MITAMLVTFFILVFLIIIVAVMRSPAVYYNDYDDEEIVTTTTTTVTTTDTPAVNTSVGLNVNGIPVVGILQRERETNGQYFVIDPVDKDKMFLNSTDDLYEDGAGKLWGLK